MCKLYEVWLNARHPKTLESVATMRVFAHDDRLRAEAIAENAHKDFAQIVGLLRVWQPGAVVGVEVRQAQTGAPVIYGLDIGQGDDTFALHATAPDWSAA
jgi:hypothetical protein